MIDLYPHQETAVSKLHNGAILWGDVGTGKTLTALAYYLAKEAPKDVYIITTAKKRDTLDWQRDAAKFGVGNVVGATVAGILTVDSWNNIAKYTDVKDAFFIFDEQRLVGSGSWVQAFIKIAKQNHWILLTATPGDTWLDYIPVFVANGFYKNRTEFLLEHVVFNRYSKFPKVERYLGVNRLVKYRNNLLVEMPYLRHTTRKTEIVPVQYDEPKFERVLQERWHVYENRPLRDVAELFLVMRKVVNSSTTRIEAVRKLLESHPKLIVFYSFDFELEMLRSLVNEDPKGKSWTTKLNGTSTRTGPSTPTTSSKESKDTKSEIVSTPQKTSPSFAIGEWNGNKHEAIPENGTKPQASSPSPSFAVAEWNGHKHEEVPTTDRWVYLVQYVAGSEGWNCTETDAMCFFSLTYSYKNWHQAHGRIDRLNTPFKTLYYYVLMSNSMIDKAVWSSLMGKKSFNESRFLKQILDTRSKEVT